MKSAWISDTSDSSQQQQKQHHHHVPKIFALSDSTPGKEEPQEQTCGQASATMLQLVRRGEGRDRMTLPNFLSKNDDNDNEKSLSLHRPILVRDTPESIGMKIPRGRDKNNTGSPKKTTKIPREDDKTFIPKGSDKTTGSPKKTKKSTLECSPKTKKKRKRPTSSTKSIPFTVRDVADVVGHSAPVQMIDVLNQEIDEDIADWTFYDMVEYFEGRQRLVRNATLQSSKQPGHTPSEETTTPASPIRSPKSHPVDNTISPRTGRSRRKAAIRSQKCLHSLFHEESSLGSASKRILNQISYEFSGTPLHGMVRSPAIVRDIDWIDHAWPAERKPRHNLPGHKGSTDQKVAMKTSKKAHKGKKSIEYPVVQYYCLTSAAGSYTDFHIDFGGSSVWYHVVSGQKIFLVSPPTRQNLRVYEEWLCHPDQSKIFLPDLMKERACPDIHRYSTNDMFSSASSVSTSSSASTAATYASCAALGDLADEMAFFRNSLKNALSTNNTLRFTLNAGETLVLPAGWIHAVYTPVDSLVFGGNFMHGLDIQMQLSVNSIEARSRVLDQYRFPHFGALQMYAGGMYLQRLRAMRREEESKITKDGCVEPNAESSASLIGVQQEQQQEREESNGKMKKGNSLKTNVSPRELEELPMLMNALEYWWMSIRDKNEIDTTPKQEEMLAGIQKTQDSVTSHSSFRDAAFHVANKYGCDSVEDFIAALRNEYALASSKQWGSYRAAPSDGPNNNSLGSPLPASLSMIPIAIGKPKKKRPKKKRKRSDSSTDLDDPLDVALSKAVKEYLASIQITTAAQLLLARTTDIAEKLPKWRKQKGMAELKGRAGAVASVSVWKRKVRLRATMVGATKLAQLNEGTNMKPLELGNDGRKPPPPKNNKYLFRRVAKKFDDDASGLPSKLPAKKNNSSANNGDGAAAIDPPRIFFGTVQRSSLSNERELWHIQYDNGNEEDLDTNELMRAFDLYRIHEPLDPPTGLTRKIYNQLPISTVGSESGNVATTVSSSIDETKFGTDSANKMKHQGINLDQAQPQKQKKPQKQSQKQKQKQSLQQPLKQALKQALKHKQPKSQQQQSVSVSQSSAKSNKISVPSTNRKISTVQIKNKTKAVTVRNNKTKSKETQEKSDVSHISQDYDSDSDSFIVI